MTFSFHQAIIPTYVQMLGAVLDLLDKAEAFCTEKGIAEAELLGRRLASDMQPFSYQVKSTVVHSIGAIEGVRKGAFSPDMSPVPESFVLLRKSVMAALDGLAALDPAEIDGFVGRDMAFVFGDHRVEFTAENFLLSFSQPNFYFHVTTIYALLRAEGLALGKRDFLGRQRRKSH